MGGLPLVNTGRGLLVVSLLGWCVMGCDREARSDDSGVGKSRSQAVEASGVPTTAATAAASSSAATAPASVKTPKAPRDLCGGQLEREGKPLPKKAISRNAAAGAPELPAELPSGGGKWTWVNFWAAWCVPCREEIPRLKSWEQRLAQRMRVAFVSIDDDQRQLEQFLGSQPETGLKASFWLKEGKEREDWLSAAAVDPDPELPVHLLVDPRGRVRCKVQGAVEDSDFEAVQALVSK